jgi:hypothetical protein
MGAVFSSFCKPELDMDDEEEEEATVVVQSFAFDQRIVFVPHY